MTEDLQSRIDNHPLGELLKRVHRARDILILAYDQQAYELNDKDLQLAEPLIKAHLLRRDRRAKGARLSRDLERVFDAALRKNRIASINTNLSDDLKHAEFMMERLLDSQLQGADDDVTYCREEIARSLESVYDTLRDGSETIHHAVDRSMGLQTDILKRRKENEYYQDQLTKLVSGFETVRKELEGEPFDQDAEVRNGILDLTIRSMEVIEEINETQKLIGQNLYRLRELEDRARRIRAVAKKLQDDPGFFPERALQAANESPMFRRPQGLAVKAFPGLDSDQEEAAYGGLVADLAARLDLELPKKEVNPSVLNAQKQEEVEAPSVPGLALFHRLFAKAVSLRSAVSALDFFHRAQPGSEIEGWADVRWLYALRQYLAAQPLTPDGRPVDEFVKLAFVTSRDRPISGTEDVDDILIYPARLTEAELPALNHVRYPGPSS